MAEPDNLIQRRMMIGVAALAAPLAASAQGVAISALSSRVVTVGQDGDYPGLRQAIDAIRSLASANSPYLVQVLPGRHDISNSTLLVPSHVSIAGSGREVTALVLSGNASRLRFSANCALSDISVEANRTGAYNTAGAIDVQWGRVVDFSIRSVNVYLTGGTGSAIDLSSGGGNTVAYLSDINIFTTATGIVCRGFNYIRNLNIFLSGRQTGTPYIGVLVPAMCRLYAWSCKVGTGYGETTRTGFGTGLEVVDDPGADVIGVYVPSTNTTVPRLQFHDLESYCRNDRAVGTTMSCVRADAGIVRLFASFLQVETPANWGLGAALLNGGGATIEVYGCTYNSASGNLSSRNQQPLTFLTTADDGITLVPGASGFHPGSVIMCDASGGPFTVRLAGDWIGGQPPGVLWTFLKTDNTANAVSVLAPGNGSISGLAAVVLGQPYATVRLMHGNPGINLWYAV